MNRHERRRARAKGQRRHHPHILFAQEGIDPAFLEAALRNSEEIDAVSIGDRDGFWQTLGALFACGRPPRPRLGSISLRPERDQGASPTHWFVRSSPASGRGFPHARSLLSPENFSDNAAS